MRIAVEGCDPPAVVQLDQVGVRRMVVRVQEQGGVGLRPFVRGAKTKTRMSMSNRVSP